MKCGECKFWTNAESVDPDAGECHRRAPSPTHEALTVILGTIRERGVSWNPRPSAFGVVEAPEATGGGLWDRKALWPTTLRTDFCGDFEPAKATKGFV